MRIAASLLLAIPLVLAGCSATEERRAEDVAGAFAEAISQNRYEEACALLARYDGSCSRRQRFDLEGLEYSDDVAVDAIEVEGDRAVATLGSSGLLSGYECCDPEPIELARLDGKWRVTIAP